MVSSGILEGQGLESMLHTIRGGRVIFVCHQFLLFPLHTKAKQMRTLELVCLPSSPTICAAAALEGGDTTEDDLTISNISQNMEGSSPIFVAVRMRPGIQTKDDEKWKAVTVQPGGKQVKIIFKK